MASGKESACQCKQCVFSTRVGKTTWRRKWQLTPVFLPGKSHGQRNLVGDSLWCYKRVRHDLVTEQQQQPYVNTDANKYYSCKWL